MDVCKFCSGFPLICLHILMGWFLHLNAEDIYVRVVDGTNGYQGKVEVYDNGTNVWYSICRDTWDDNAANVVCRMLGYTSVSGFVMKVENTDIGWNRNVSCNGNEALLSECKLTPFNFRKCYVAGVDCSKSGIPEGFFLMGGYSNVIRMDDMTWAYITIPKPDVRETRGLAYDSKTDAVYWTDRSNVKNLSLATGKITTMFTKKIINDVYLGLAVDIYKRLLFFGDHNHADIWKVDLDNSEEKVKILDGAINVQHIEVDPEEEKIYWLDLHYDVVREADYNGKNSRVVMSKIRQFEFSEMFTLDDEYVYITNTQAKDILVHGRYNNAKRYINISMYNNYKGITQWNDYIYLFSSKESRLIKVNKDGSSVAATGSPIKDINTHSNLRHYGLTAADMFIRVTNAVRGNAGNIQVYDNTTSKWYSLCNGTWGDEEATVACKMLGYTSARGKVINGQGSGQGLEMNMKCNGDENSLNYCRMRPEIKPKCDYMGIDCALSGRPRGFFLMFSYREIYRMDEMTHSYIIRATSSENTYYGPGYDHVTDFVFWSNGKDIFYASLSNETDGLFVKGPGGSNVAIRDVVVDSRNRKLFYSDYNHADIWLLELDHQSKTQKKFLDGALSGIKIAVDPDRKLLFWFDLHFRKLREINYDGSNERVIASFTKSLIATSSGLDFTIDENHAYVHIGDARAIYINNRFNSSTEVINITNYNTKAVAQLDDYLYCVNTGNQPLLAMQKDGTEQILAGPPVSNLQKIRHFTGEQGATITTTSSSPTIDTTAVPTTVTSTKVMVTMSTTFSQTISPMSTLQPTTAVQPDTTTSESTAAQSTTVRTTTTSAQQPLSSTETIVIAVVVAVVMLILGIVLGIFIYRRCCTSLPKTPSDKENYMTSLSKRQGQENEGYDMLNSTNTVSSNNALPKIPSDKENYMTPLSKRQGQENEGYDMLNATNTVSSNKGDEHVYFEILADNKGQKLPENRSSDISPPVYFEIIPEQDNKRNSDGDYGKATVF